MSIGLAFVKGLVGGFQRNIDREREARGADDARIAELENFVFQAATDPKKRVPKELGRIIQDGKRQLADREPIDIFGRSGDRLSLDMTNLQQLAMGAEDENLIKIGTYSFPGTPTYFETTTQNDGFKRSTQYWKSLQDHFASDPNNYNRFRQHFESKPNERMFLNADFKKNQDDYNVGYIKTNSIRGKEQEIISMLYTDILKDYKGLAPIWDLYEGADSTASEADSLQKTYSKFLKDNEIQGSLVNKFSSLIFPYQKEGKLLAMPYSPVDKDERKIFDEMAEDYGYKGRTNRFIFDYVNKFSPNKMYEGEINLENPEANIRNAYGYLFHAVQLRKLNVNDPVKIEKDLVMDYLNTTFGQGDKAERQKILALSIAMKPPTKPGGALESKGLLTYGVSKEKEMLGILGVKKSDYEDGFQAALKAEKQLEKLFNTTKDIKLSDGLIKEMYRLGYGIFGKGGQFSQAIDLLTANSNDDRALFERTIQKVFNKSSVDEIGQIEALKIELAFNLARAADPSGRLSNQDFEVQLRRLGTTGIFTNIPTQLAAIQQVLDDTKSLVDSRRLIHAIYTSPATGPFNVLSDKERRIVHAAVKYHRYRRETQEVGQPNSRVQYIGSATDKNKRGNDKYVPDTSPNADPNFVIDTDSFELVPRSHIKDGDKI